jgi:hypothetical protein
LTLESGQLESSPLMRADLESEIEAFEKVGYRLTVTDKRR